MGYIAIDGASQVSITKKAGPKTHHSSIPAFFTAEGGKARFCNNRDMITLILNACKPITQEIYDKLIEELPLYQIKCSCGQAGCLVHHAHYNRTLKRHKSTISLCVLRVKCKACGRTHAILVDQIVPYEQVSSDVQQEMIRFTLWSDEIQTLLKENYDINESDVHAVKRRYKKYWKERLITMGRSIVDSIEELVRSSFSTFHRQFMQIRRGINLPNFAIHLA